jgi:hypothetical protein
MPLHLIRMSPSVPDPRGFKDLMAEWARPMPGFDGPVCVDMTRNVPKRDAEILDGGSVYWLFRKALRVRTPILDIRRVAAKTDEGRPVTVAAIIFSPDAVGVVPKEHPRIQGWRYLADEERPRDLDAGAGDALPDSLKKELAELGLV